MSSTSLSQSTYSTREFSINGRTYRPPARPVVGICIDGCADEYLSASMVRGRMPHVSRIARDGYRGFVRGALPSFTNVNNAAIATGIAPSKTGISGNFFLDPDTGEEVMMNSASYLRCGTIFAEAAKVGRKVGVVTAKEKLRDILSSSLEGIAFSSERADEAVGETHGIDNVEQLVGLSKPEIYSADASVYVLQAGVALLEHKLADFLYLSLTDFMQHKFTPESEPSLAFYEAMDQQIGRLMELGAVIGITADHGMNAKNDADGRPNVIYLESLLTKQFGAGQQVICPITDPYVVHHGALGSFVTVHLSDAVKTDQVAAWILALPGITEVYSREVAAEQLELPADRIGDLVVMSARDVVIGRTVADHDLSHLEGGLRSHGGRYEEMVPFLISEPIVDEYATKLAGDPRNFDLFEFTCNGVMA
ncbi:MAG: phosphonoacetate hydrolase [Pirellulaceae bacterium]|nr:phosphonoacetate hydrolase [Pirellulaceae bacterium]